MSDIYFDENDTPEQREAQRIREEADAELARKIRREVLRVQSGEAQEDIEREAEEQREEEAAAKEVEERDRRLRHKRNASPFWQIITGSILVSKGVARYYFHMIALAVMFFLSIVVMFFSLHQDMKYIRLEKETRLLRESSLRYQSQRYELSSHSAIIRQLRERGIALEEASAPSTLID